MANIPCPDCKGKRLKSESLAVTVGGMNIAELSDMTVRHAREKLSALTLNKTEEMIAEQDTEGNRFPPWLPYKRWP